MVEWGRHEKVYDVAAHRSLVMKTKATRNGSKRKATMPPPDDWEKLWQVMVRKVDQMQAELDHLRAENKMLRYNIYMLMDKDYGKPIDKEKLLAQAVPCSIDEIVAELQQRE
jgi:hypothetical protein